VLHPKKVGTLPIEGCDKEKQTNEIKIAIPLLDAINIEGKTITGDALLTQRKFGRYLVKDRKAHYHFTAKGNQKQLMEDIAFYFENIDCEPEFTTVDPPDHGRIETRKIWTTTELNDYLDFPYVGQAFMVERITYFPKSGEEKSVKSFGITSKTPDLATPEDVLKDNRGHWSIENKCHYIIDWNYDEDRSRIAKGYGPENMTRLRRFAVGLYKSKGVTNVSQKMRQLLMAPRTVLDYMKMTENSCTVPTT